MVWFSFDLVSRTFLSQSWFYAWANVELELMIKTKTQDLELELANLDVARFELEDKIAERASILESLKILRKAGYGN